MLREGLRAVQECVWGYECLGLRAVQECVSLLSVLLSTSLERVGGSTAAEGKEEAARPQASSPPQLVASKGVGKEQQHAERGRQRGVE